MGLLELVTDSVGEYDRLIKRTAFLYSNKDRRFICLLLEHLRDVRHRLVHEGEVGSNIEIYLYQFVGGGGDPLSSASGEHVHVTCTAAECLDIPIDLEILTRRICDCRSVLSKV
jgi:hypothetical protein